MEMQKAVFMNKELNLRLAGLLYLPTNFDLSKNYPAVVVTGPMLSVKEQAQSVYAKRLTEAGYVTLVFDGAYFGESEGMPRGQELPDVKERVDLYFEQQDKFKEQLKAITQIHDKVAVIDLRKEDVIYAGNRFMVYAMWPEVELSVHVAWGFKKQNTAVMIGKSIINRNSHFDIGQLCLSYGGGGHANAGTCQLDNDKIDAELPTIIDKLNGKIPV